ncbi:MAG: hypothetical protein DLM60_09475 [Pseudonocardiales bacterium]|nr:hypothetical protein [Actinomycetota bacterium]PZS19871.1 MAG: hypothetical protein DLM60_09475 [Pseudonocardiales bacterium]
MEIYMTIGARYFPQCGSVGVPGGIWSKRLRTAPSGVLRRSAGHRLHLARFGAQVSTTGIDLLVTDRMHMSASEP